MLTCGYGGRLTRLFSSVNHFDQVVKSKKHSLEPFQFMTMPELQDNLKQISLLQDAPDDFIESLAEQLFPELSREYEEVAAKLFQTTVTSSMHSKRKTVAEFQVRVCFAQRIKDPAC